MNEADQAALNQIRESLRAGGYRDAEEWSARLMSLTPEERTAFVDEEIARSGRGVADTVEPAKSPPTASGSELAAKLDELHAAIQHLPFSDRMEILRGLADTAADRAMVDEVTQDTSRDDRGQGDVMPTSPPRRASARWGRM